MAEFSFETYVSVPRVLAVIVGGMEIYCLLRKKFIFKSYLVEGLKRISQSKNQQNTIPLRIDNSAVLRKTWVVEAQAPLPP